MDTEKLQKQTDQVIDYWIAEVKGYNYDQLIAKPSATEWSIGQVGIHLWMSGKGFFFKNAERCLNKENAEKGKGKNLTGHLVFTFRTFPPVKVKMPDKVAVEPRQPDSIEHMVSKLEEVKTLARQYINRIPQSDPAFKTKHPFMGWLNTAEWVQLCNIHFRHHIKQKKRIESHFGYK
jgi:hypothetical protein